MSLLYIVEKVLSTRFKQWVDMSIWQLKIIWLQDLRRVFRKGLPCLFKFFRLVFEAMTQCSSVMMNKYIQSIIKERAKLQIWWKLNYQSQLELYVQDRKCYLPSVILRRYMHGSHMILHDMWEFKDFLILLETMKIASMNATKIWQKKRNLRKLFKRNLMIVLALRLITVRKGSKRWSRGAIML